MRGCGVPKTANAHSAAGQALGYLHQVMWALVAFGEAARKDPGVVLRLEHLDDVDLEYTDGLVEVLQVKHHARDESPAADKSVDLWRTLNVWMDLHIAPNLQLRLVTTQVAADDSALAHLRDVDRSVPLALDRLRDVAHSSQNKATEPWRQRFAALGHDKQEQLVSAVFVNDGSEVAADLDDAIRRTFRFALPLHSADPFIDALRGWWTRRATQLLGGESPFVSGDELLINLEAIGDGFKADNLPPIPGEEALDKATLIDEHKDSVFVQQLVWIAFSQHRLWMAIRDYHRAYTHQAYWLRNQLVGSSELERFARNLRDEWEEVFESHIQRMTTEGRADQDAVGLDIYEDLVTSSQARVRDRFNEPWFNKGLLHALANGEFGQHIGWHPDFKQRLEGLLAQHL